jgi:hypothetical protein
MTQNPIYFHRSAALYFIAFLACVALAGYYKTANNDGGERRTRFTGVGAWSVNGIKVGQTLAEVEALLGKHNPTPTKVQPSVYVWPDRVMIELDTNQRVTTVYGNTLIIGDTKVIEGTLSHSQAQQILGDGWKKVFHSPKDSGVLSTGSVVSGTSLTYAREGGFFLLHFNKNDQLTTVNVHQQDPNATH